MDTAGLDEHRREVEALRHRKDHMLTTDPDSPLPRAERASFRGLHYFPVDPKYRIRAKLKADPSPPRVRMMTSTGTDQEFLRIGSFDFTLDGQPLRLFAYRSAPPPGHEHHARADPLFVPFRDASSGKETYGAARYLDLEASPTNEYVLDFNLAYNPYCAYSDDFVCPFPPRENTLPVPIRAGEKVYKAP